MIHQLVLGTGTYLIIASVGPYVYGVVSGIDLDRSWISLPLRVAFCPVGLALNAGGCQLWFDRRIRCKVARLVATGFAC